MKKKAPKKRPPLPRKMSSKELCISLNAIAPTAVGQLVYDLAFTELSERYLARKHWMPVAEIRRYRALPSMVALIKQNKRRRKRKAR